MSQRSGSDNPNMARKYWRELALLEPENLAVRLALFDLAMTAGEGSDAVALVEEIRKAEGEEGVSWRFAKAAVVIDRVRRGTSHDLEEARLLTAEISQRRPLWANGFALAGEIADLSGSDDQAIWDYLKAVELGSVQPSLIRRLVGLLNERQRFDEIDHLTHVLRDQGAALNEVTVIQALDAISKRDFERGIALARNVFPQTSTSYSDHLTLGRLLMAAGRSDDAGKEFQRSVELGPGVPESWLTYVQYLVQTKQTDQARAAAAAARNALPADRSELAVAQCSMITGDPQRAEALIQEVLRVKPQDHAALRLAASLYSGQNRVDKAHEYLDRLDSSAANSAYDKAWTNRSRACCGSSQAGMPIVIGHWGSSSRTLRPIPVASRTKRSEPLFWPCGRTVKLRRSRSSNRWLVLTGSVAMSDSCLRGST